MVTHPTPRASAPRASLAAPESPSEESAKVSSSERLWRRHFPGVARLTARAGTYSVLPWYLRSVMHVFTAREWQLLTYFIMQGGKDAISWTSDREIGLAFGMGHKKLGPYIKNLEALGFIASKTVGAKRYVLVRDPYEALKALVNDGRIKGDKLEALNDDLQKAKYPELQPGSNQGGAP